MKRIIMGLMLLSSLVFVANTAVANMPQPTPDTDMKKVYLVNDVVEDKTAHVEFRDNATGKIRIPKVKVNWGGPAKKYTLTWDANKETLIKLSWVEEGCPGDKEDIYKGKKFSNGLGGQSYMTVTKHPGHNNYSCKVW